jgi:signal transduction histidine kinase
LASGRINLRRQLVRPYLQSAGWPDIEELEGAPPDSEIHAVTTAELLTFNTGGRAGRRVRLRGTVTAAFADGTVFLRDEKGSAAVELNPFVKVEEGDRLEVVGFLEMSRFSASIVDGKVRTRTAGSRAAAVETSVASLFALGFDSELVMVKAVVVDWVPNDKGVMLLLRDDAKTVRVHVAGATVGPEFGAVVSATGICQVESANVQPYRSVPATVSLRVSGPANVIVVRSPPWWTTRRMMIALAIVATMAMAAAAWILMLRRHVRSQTEVLRRKIEQETAFEERQRLAREFHDTLEQDLTGVSLQLSTACARNFDDQGRGLVNASRNLIGHIQREVQTLVSDLRETDQGRSGSVDLVALLRQIAEERAIDPGLCILVDAGEEVVPVPAPVAYHLRMMVQECITNVMKHAQARRIQIALATHGQGLMLTVTDDGIGFDPSAETFGKRGHFGCMGIRERCLKLGAKVVWRSAPGAGTSVEVTLAEGLRSVA